jgi:hypothetical protein
MISFICEAPFIPFELSPVFSKNQVVRRRVMRNKKVFPMEMPEVTAGAVGVLLIFFFFLFFFITSFYVYIILFLLVI